MRNGNTCFIGLLGSSEDYVRQSVVERNAIYMHEAKLSSQTQGIGVAWEGES